MMFRTFVAATFIAAVNSQCSVCGDGQEVGAPDTIFAFSGQPGVRCDVLEQSGETGLIPANQCGWLPKLIADTCRCQPTEASVQPALAPVTIPIPPPPVPTEVSVQPAIAPIAIPAPPPPPVPTEASVQPAIAPVTIPIPPPAPVSIPSPAPISIPSPPTPAPTSVDDDTCVCYGDINPSNRARSLNSPKGARRSLREEREEKLQREALQVLGSGRHLKGSSTKGDDNYRHEDDNDEQREALRALQSVRHYGHGDDDDEHDISDVRDCECHEVCEGGDDVSILLRCTLLC